MHRKTLSKLTLGLVLVLFASPLQAQDYPAAEELVRRAQNNFRMSGFEALTRMEIHDGRGNSRILEMATISGWYPDEAVEKRLMRFLSPADVRGTGLLTFDYDESPDDMWLYLPSLRRARRMASNEKSGNFVGSEFTFADMTAFSLTDFDFMVENRLVVRGRECYLLVQTPKNRRIEREYGYARREVALLVEESVVWESRYFDARGRATRIMTADNVTRLGAGHFRPLFLEMENLRNGRSSRLITTQWQVSESIAEDYFTVPNLETETL